MVSNTWYQYKGSWYYLGPDGAMLKGLQTINGKWYYLDEEGRMATEPVVLTPDQDGALHYPGLVNKNMQHEMQHEKEKTAYLRGF